MYGKLGNIVKNQSPKKTIDTEQNLGN